MRFIQLVFTILTTVSIHASTATTECFIAQHNDITVAIYGDVTTQYSPCSTFKIVLSLIGFDMNILKTNISPLWRYEPEYIHTLSTWKQDHNPSLWIKNSCVWYSQILAEAIGMPAIQHYLSLFNYGNKDFSGGLTAAWLDSSLRISPLEQIEFLAQLVSNKLPVSTHALQTTKHLLFLEDLGDGCKLFGKTGTGDEACWLIGWFEREQNYYIFAFCAPHQILSRQERLQRVKTLFWQSIPLNYPYCT